MSPALVNRAWMYDSLTTFLFATRNYLNVNLFTNNVVPGEDDNMGVYDLASYPGYVGSSWGNDTAAVPSGNQVALPTATFVFPPPNSGSPVDVYGFVVSYLDGAIGEVPFFVSLFPTPPITLSMGGSGIALTLSANALDLNNP